MSYSNGRKRSKRSHKKRTYYMADFETTTDPMDCRVWGYGIENIYSPGVELGTTLDEFMHRIDADNAVIFFHNLKFDGHFIIDWLLKHDYTYTADGRKVSHKQFTTLISDKNMFYSVTIRFASGIRVELRDSYKKLPMSVSRVAKSFKLPETKGEIDYHALRPLHHSLTVEEKNYITRDVNIVSTALKVTLDSGADKLTVGSDALHEFKKVLGENEFVRLFPVFNHTLDGEIRRAYRGGFTYPDPRFSRSLQGAGQVFDVNSLYPSVMYFQPMPYGEPEYVDGFVEPTAHKPLTIFSVTFTAKLKPGHIPCIQVKGSSQFVPTEYQTHVKDPTTLMVTDVDWKLYNDHYDVDVLEFGGGWRFAAVEGVFSDYIDKWSKVKETSEGGIRELAKLMLNSLYGKFASNPNVTGKYPVLEDGRVVYRRGPEEQRNPVYTAVGVYITSYARDVTIRAAQQSYDVFAYADTDSLHLLSTTTPESLDIHPTRMGAWKHEYDFVAAKYLRSKAYLEKHADGTYTNRIAGLPEHVSSRLTFDDVKSGTILHGKLRPQSVPGGIVLVDTPYELKY